jgi:hypothetical protein
MDHENSFLQDPDKHASAKKKNHKKNKKPHRARSTNTTSRSLPRNHTQKRSGVPSFATLANSTPGTGGLEVDTEDSMKPIPPQVTLQSHYLSHKNVYVVKSCSGVNVKDNLSIETCKKLNLRPPSVSMPVPPTTLDNSELWTKKAIVGYMQYNMHNLIQRHIDNVTPENAALQSETVLERPSALMITFQNLYDLSVCLPEKAITFVDRSTAMSSQGISLLEKGDWPNCNNDLGSSWQKTEGHGVHVVVRLKLCSRVLSASDLNGLDPVQHNLLTTNISSIVELAATPGDLPPGERDCVVRNVCAHAWLPRAFLDSTRAWVQFGIPDAPVPVHDQEAFIRLVMLPAMRSCAQGSGCTNVFSFGLDPSKSTRMSSSYLIPSIAAEQQETNTAWQVCSKCRRVWVCPIHREVMVTHKSQCQREDYCYNQTVDLAVRFNTLYTSFLQSEVKRAAICARKQNTL